MAQRKIGSSAFPGNERAGFVPGDQHAYRAASALADRLDAPTLIALTDAISYAVTMGGQVFAVTLRDWVNRNGEEVPEDQPGEWRTVGISFFYETRDARMVIAKPPEEALGVPVTDFRDPPTIRVEDDASPAAPEVETDLRDEIEAEVEEALASEDEQPTPAG